MKIKDIRTIALSCKVDPPYASASGVQSRRGGLLVEIETDSGITGIGEAGLGGGATATVIEKDLKPLLIGEDPLMIEGLWQKMFVRTRQYGRRGVVMHGISGIDIALWDIAGKVAGLPVYKLLGACRDRVEAYASGGFYQEGKSVSDLAGEAEGYRARGFKGMKMKIGRNPSTQTHLRQLIGNTSFCETDPSEDLERIAAVRQALGPQAKLMVDVNCAWSSDFAIQMGHEMERYKLYWIEEPVATDDIDGSAKVAAALTTPIAGYETELGLYAFRELISRNAVDIVQLDLAWTGGFSEGRRIAAYAGAHHRMVAPHALCRRRIADVVIAFRGVDPERARPRMGPEPECDPRGATEGAIQARKRQHDQTARSTRSRH